MWGLGFKVWGLGFKRCRALGSEVSSLGCRVQGFRVVGFRVLDS